MKLIYVQTNDDDAEGLFTEDGELFHSLDVYHGDSVDKGLLKKLGHTVVTIYLSIILEEFDVEEPEETDLTNEVSNMKEIKKYISKHHI